jgi:hypothetical protein
MLPVDSIQIETLQMNDIDWGRVSTVHEKIAGRICCLPGQPRHELDLSSSVSRSSYNRRNEHREWNLSKDNLHPLVQSGANHLLSVTAADGLGQILLDTNCVGPWVSEFFGPWTLLYR